MVMVGAYKLEREYQIVIYNEGSGFDPEQIKFLGAFTQFDREMQEQQGVGMGMAIVLSLLKVYKGHIKVLTEKSRYTKIEIYLKSLD
jgi:K+-sensing histidine kinase KdpD